MLFLSYHLIYYYHHYNYLHVRENKCVSAFFSRIKPENAFFGLALAEDYFIGGINNKEVY
jgi:hypothetical protein